MSRDIGSRVRPRADGGDFPTYAHELDHVHEQSGAGYSVQRGVQLEFEPCPESALGSDDGSPWLASSVFWHLLGATQ